MQVLETLYQNDISRISIDRRNGVIMNAWLRPVEHDEMVVTADRINQFLRETESDKLLLSALLIGKLLPETKEWLSTTYYKSLSELGIKKLARVLPDNVFNRLTFESVITRAEAMGTVNFEVRNFSTDKAALLWLLEDTL
ncbi:hypothetical protein H9Q13_09210 [Pontibacter sp. JH31]|uniref:STAS/SEC14 domain-containing protein n=1 Tax=Pontibacter aquaedesilientis TaxID=2766980 RepID=A0ABR7XGD8_9BACT|nr:hypothetical protein [Pontibacter aquaedesilientis]MBD1397341.1 hypothetical protein [Pontibacter aquaedesilientis]